MVSYSLRAAIQHLGMSKPGAPVEVILGRGHVDVEVFLDWQFSRAFGLVHYGGLFLSDEVVILPSMFCY